MAKIERLLVPGSTELPDCRCGKEMAQGASQRIGSDAEVRVYCCSACGHEMRLTVWLDPPLSGLKPLQVSIVTAAAITTG
jgi:hypothetical protein